MNNFGWSWYGFCFTLALLVISTVIYKRYWKLGFIFFALAGFFIGVVEQQASLLQAIGRTSFVFLSVMITVTYYLVFVVFSKLQERVKSMLKKINNI